MENVEYGEKVMQHFLNPHNVGELPGANGIGNVGNPVCAAPDTLVFVNPDIKKIRDIGQGVRVLSHDGKYHEVSKIYERPYKGNMYSIKTTNLGTNFLTPEHHVLALKLGKRNKFLASKKAVPDWFCAEELRKGDVVLYPIPRDTADVAEIDFDVDRPKWDFKSKSLPAKVKIDNDFCRLAGYYLSEGYVRTDKCKGTVGFVFNSKEKDYIQDVIGLLGKTFGVTPAALMFNSRKTATDIAFYSARLARFFEKHFGKGAQNKHIPFWMMRLPLEKQSALLCGLWRGDGYFDIKRQRAKYVTISKQLVYQLRMLLFRQRIISNFSKGRAYGIHKESYLCYIQDDESLKKMVDILGLCCKIKPRQKNIHKSWFDEKFYFTTIREIRSFDYNGLVYNLEVDDAHSYVSDALTLHNCGDIMRLYIKVEDGKIVDARFKTFGCGAAIATSSMVTDLVKGKTLEEALQISNKAVAEALGGLPKIKMHCSVLAEEALRAAIEDYKKKQEKA